MRRTGLVWGLLLLLGTLCPAAQQPGNSSDDQFLGAWTGNWAGAGAGGGLEMTLEKNDHGAVTGRVSVTGEPTYKAAFRTLAFDGKKMSARYDFPPEEAAEVVLTATFDGNTAKGRWSLRERATDNEVDAGTWTVTRK